MSLYIDLVVKDKNIRCSNCGHVTGIKKRNFVYSGKIEFNLIKTAKKAGFWYLWGHRESKIIYAGELVQSLTSGLVLLKNNQKFNLSNKNYNKLAKFIEEYLQACKEYPDATISQYADREPLRG